MADEVAHINRLKNCQVCIYLMLSHVAKICMIIKRQPVAFEKPTVM